MDVSTINSEPVRSVAVGWFIFIYIFKSSSEDILLILESG